MTVEASDPLMAVKLSLERSQGEARLLFVVSDVDGN